MKKLIGLAIVIWILLNIDFNYLSSHQERVNNKIKDSISEAKRTEFYRKELNKELRMMWKEQRELINEPREEIDNSITFE